MFKLVLEKAEEPEIKLPSSVDSSKKQESSKKTSTSALLTMPKPLTVWITTNWKILQVRLQQYMNCKIPDVQAGFRKGRGTTDQIANICWIIERAREFQKKSTSALLATPKPLTVWITTNCGEFFKRWEYQTTLLAF